MPRLLFTVTLAAIALPALPVHAQDSAAEDDGPEIIELTGVVRDFREGTDAGGHPDFERRPSAGFGHYAGNVAAILGEDGKPVFTGEGQRIINQATDAAGYPIAPHLANRRVVDGEIIVDESLADTPATYGVSSTGGIDSSTSFAQWYRDQPGVNMSAPLTLSFQRQRDGSYVFEDKHDPVYEDLNGFFPIEDALFGNPGGSPDRNFHFTFELHTEFTYSDDAEQVFRFVGDDDVWVFINDILVIDLGGVHSATEQYVDLNRLGLEDGETYELTFFFAERHRTQSNFRIVTNLQLESIKMPTVTAAFD